MGGRGSSGGGSTPPQHPLVRLRRWPLVPWPALPSGACRNRPPHHHHPSRPPTGPYPPQPPRCSPTLHTRAARVGGGGGAGAGGWSALDSGWGLGCTAQTKQRPQRPSRSRTLVLKLLKLVILLDVLMGGCCCWCCRGRGGRTGAGTGTGRGGRCRGLQEGARGRRPHYTSLPCSVHDPGTEALARVPRTCSMRQRIHRTEASPANG